MLKLVLGQISVLLLVCWVDIKVIPVWTTGKLQRKFLGTYKAPRTICSPIGSQIILK